MSSIPDLLLVSKIWETFTAALCGTTGIILLWHCSSSRCPRRTASRGRKLQWQAAAQRCASILRVIMERDTLYVTGVYGFRAVPYQSLQLHVCHIHTYIHTDTKILYKYVHLVLLSLKCLRQSPFLQDMRLELRSID